MAGLLIRSAASAALLAQTSAPEKPPIQATVLDARPIVVQSLAATERSWQARDHYPFTEWDQDRRLDSAGFKVSWNFS